MRQIKIPQADAPSGCKHNKRAKIAKARRERRRAKVNPEAPPTYGRYWGYVS